MSDEIAGLTIYTVMERDYRLTGKFRGQADSPEAPLGFEG